MVRACFAMADAGGEAMVRHVKSFTPVDTGELRESIYQLPVTASGHVGITGVGGEYSSGAATDVGYAEFVERGTGLFGPFHTTYTIRPKTPDGWLRWIDPVTGRPVFAKEVVHKGSEGAFMFVKGVAATEAEIDRIVAPALSKWAFEQEHSNPWAV